MTTVLLTNGLLSKTLAAVRSLGSRGIRTIVAEKSRWHTSGFSKYCSKTLVSPDPALAPKKYMEWLIDTLRKERCDVLFIMDDDTMKLAIENREQLESICQVPLPPTDGYLIAADKGKTIRLANQLGVPCPKTVELQNSELNSQEELIELCSTFQYPLVIKPRHSSGSRGIRIVQNQDDFIDTFYNVVEKYPDPIIQEFIPRGPKYDVGLCYDKNHNLKAAYVQKQIRNYPLDRGPSTVHESVEYPELIEHARTLMEHLQWYGVADIEFMIDPRNQEPKLLEINPRFWSSLHLSIRTGVDFPYILYQLALGNTVSQIDTYTLGKRGKAVFPGDSLHFISNPSRWQMDPPFWSTQLPDDIMSWHDPMPTAGFLLSALRYSFDLNMWKFLIRR